MACLLFVSLGCQPDEPLEPQKGVTTVLDGEARHPVTGRLPTIFLQVAYDVDSGAAYGIDHLRAVIDGAEARAAATSLPHVPDGTADEIRQLVAKWRKLHFWPNIVNLTEVYYQDRALYDRILAELLEGNLDAAQLTADLNEQTAAGDRVFLARDFLSSVAVSAAATNRSYHEVHYALAVNLDARRLRELHSHQQTMIGLGTVHDPAVAELAAVFNDQDEPLGEAWQLCLRGNFNQTRYRALIVDRLNRAPKAEFFIARVHRTCGPAAPLEEEPPWKLPPQPPPPEPPGQVPAPPHNPEHPPPPVCVDCLQGAPVILPWPFRKHPLPAAPSPSLLQKALADPGYLDPLLEDCAESTSIANELAAQAWQAYSELKGQLGLDVKTFNGFIDHTGHVSGSWQSGLAFELACMKSLYAQFSEHVDALAKQIDTFRQEGKLAWEQQEKRKASLPARLRTANYRTSLLSNMWFVGGPWWTAKTAAVHFWPLQPKNDVLIVDARKLAPAFETHLKVGMMAGLTWDNAIAKALDAVAGSETTTRSLLFQYGLALKESMKKMAKEFLPRAFEGLASGDLDGMVDVLLGGEQALLANEIQTWEAFVQDTKSYQSGVDERAMQIHKLELQIDTLRRQFREAARSCIDKNRRSANEIAERARLLEGHESWCEAMQTFAKWDGWQHDKALTKEELCDALEQLRLDLLVGGSGPILLRYYVTKLLEQECGYQPLECEAKPDGTPCSNDGACLAGSCVQQCEPLDCDDGDPCTEDDCLQGQCLHTAISSPDCAYGY